MIFLKKITARYLDSERAKIARAGILFMFYSPWHSYFGPGTPQTVKICILLHHLAAPYTQLSKIENDIVREFSPVMFSLVSFCLEFDQLLFREQGSEARNLSAMFDKREAELGVSNVGRRVQPLAFVLAGCTLRVHSSRHGSIPPRIFFQSRPEQLRAQHTAPESCAAVYRASSCHASAQLAATLSGQACGFVRTAGCAELCCHTERVLASRGLPA